MPDDAAGRRTLHRGLLDNPWHVLWVVPALTLAGALLFRTATGEPVTAFLLVANPLAGLAIAGAVLLWRRAAARDAEGYRKMFEENQSVLLLIDPAGDVIVDANPAACRFYGRPREELVGKPLDEFTEVVPSAEPRSGGGGNPNSTVSYEIRHRGAKGALRDVEIHTSPLRLAGRDLTFAVVHDLTIRRSAEREVLRQRSRFLNVMDDIDEGVFRSTPDGRIAFANAALARLLGYGSVEEMGTSLADVGRQHYVDPALRDVLVRALELRGSVQGFEFEIVRTDGTRAWLSENVRAVRDGSGKIVAYEGTLRDVTARKRADQELGASEELFRTLFDGSPMPMLVYDLDTLRLLAVNEAAIVLYGYSREEFLGMGIRDIRPPEDVPALERHVESVRISGDGAVHEVRHRRKDGSPMVVEVTARPVGFRGRTGRLVAIHDVTERKSLEAQLLQAQKMEAIGRLAGGIAHDFNNMLVVILGYSEITLSKLGPGHPAAHYVESIRKAGQQSAALTRQLLSFSRRQITQKAAIDLNDVVRRMEGMLPQILGEDVELVLSLAPDLGRAHLDPSQVEQVVLNLAVNARDAMPRGGRLVIDTCNVDLDESYARNRLVPAAGPHVMLSVLDTGSGMDEGTMSRLFEPFFTTKEPGKGTGLGLATVYAIAQDGGGGVWARSTPGLGTTFKVCFPRVDAPAAPPPREAGDADAAGGHETVLLVEDEEMVRGIARAALVSHGYRVLAAEGGEQALRILREEAGRVDLLLTDVVMPGMNGRVLADRARGLREGLKVLYMSGYTEDTTLLNGVEAGRMNFLQKPFSPAILAQHVRTLLDS